MSLNIFITFAVKEAKNVRESSLVVFGSNSATGQVINNKQAEKSLELEEAEKSLQAEQEAQKEMLKELIKKLN